MLLEAPYLRPLLTLAAVSPGTPARIRYIAFRGIRAACEEAGVREGDVVTLRTSSPNALVLDAPDGGTVALDAAWARFIEVDLRGADATSNPTRGRAPLHSA